MNFPPFHPFCFLPFGSKGKRVGIGSTKKGEKGGKRANLLADENFVSGKAFIRDKMFRKN
jgi:hypothetical protein